MSDCGTECKCEGPGYCPVYGITMGPSLYKKCKESEVWRDNFMNFFSPPQGEEAIQHRERLAAKDREQVKHRQQLDEVISEVEQAGVDVNNEESHEGLGDLLGSVFSKLGITDEAVEKWACIGGCGCDKRKQFLNKILPFKKSEPSIAPKKKT